MAKASLVYQVNTAFQKLNYVGKKKDSRKRNKKAMVGINHGQTLKNYISLSCTFAKWAKRNYGIKYLVELNRDIGRAYFNYMIQKGCSAYTLKAIKSALKKLEEGIARAFNYHVKIVPRDLKLPGRSLRDRRGRRAYTEEEVGVILAAAHSIDRQAAKVLEVQARFGLRLSEALNLRKTDVHFDRGRLIVWRGKGGRLREVPIDSESGWELLQELCYGKGEMDLLFPEVTVSKVEYVMEKACHLVGIEDHKTHNLRHHYAVEQYEKKIEEGKASKQARKEVSEALGHNRPEVTYSYVPARRRL